MVYNKSDFKKHIETIEINGFKIRSAVQAYLLEQKKNNRIETITISYCSYAPHGFYVDGISASIYFNEVEEIIAKFLEKHQVKSHYGNATIQKSFVGLKDVDYSKFELEINNEESFNAVAEEIKKIINFAVIPFFEKLKTVRDVWLATEEMPIKEMARFIVQPLPQRRMVIKYLCDDPTYNNYVEWLIEYLKSENDNNWIEIEGLDIFLKNSSFKKSL